VAATPVSGGRLLRQALALGPPVQCYQPARVVSSLGPTLGVAPARVPTVAGFRDPHLEHDPAGLSEVPQHIDAMVKAMWAGTVLPSGWNMTGAFAAASLRSNSNSSSVNAQPGGSYQHSRH
jgi:hypothetical protein